MSKKSAKKTQNSSNAYIEGSGTILNQLIVETLEKNYMPYAMSVIVSRALPQIDGFKPSHRKILYTMYTMGLLNGNRTKSANIVGQTMKLNPHGDNAIYETMVRLSRGNETLLHPYIDSKGNFGKAYSRDMAYAASRYTEAKLSDICKELFSEIDKDTVNFCNNYDNTMLEPILLPVTFPSILVNANVGIAVSMASSICSFNLKEVCDTTIGLINSIDHNISDTLLGPDFTSGGLIIKDDQEFEKIYSTGRGSFKIRARYVYDKECNCIDIFEIPSTTTIEVIIDKTIEFIKQGKIKEISDIRDETGLSGLKITIDLKRGVDPDKLMRKLYKLTTLQDNFSCNFNILINSNPRVMGIKEILLEWIKFRVVCVKRKINYSLTRLASKLHLLLGLEKVLLDIDRVISIIRGTEDDEFVIPNLIKEFNLDNLQAEYIADMKLRNLNKNYILNKVKEIDDFKKEISYLKSILNNESKIKSLISDELKIIGNKYDKKRKSLFIYNDQSDIQEEYSTDEDYLVNLFITNQGYFKKIIPQSLRMNSEHKLKHDDYIVSQFECTNFCDIIYFTNKSKIYKVKACDFKDTKASSIGEYIPAKCGFEKDEKIVCMIATKNYAENILLFFDDGRVIKTSLENYKTKTKRKKLLNIYANRSNLLYVYMEQDNNNYIITTTFDKKLIFNSSLLSVKNSKDIQGDLVVKLVLSENINSVEQSTNVLTKEEKKYVVNSIPISTSKLKLYC